MNRTIKGLWKSARPGMVPTLFTNALAAWCTARTAGPGRESIALYFAIVAMGLCFFLYGMWENDRVDARWDRQFRPGRPVPQGDISTWSLRIASFIAGLAGLFLCAMLTDNALMGALLLVVITLYNWLHKKYGASIILMGLCRGIWVLAASSAVIRHLGQAAVAPEQALPAAATAYATSLALYTMAVSWIARGENKSRLRLLLAGLLLPAMALHDAIWLIGLQQWFLAVIAFGCYAFSLFLRGMKQRTT